MDVSHSVWFHVTGLIFYKRAIILWKDKLSPDWHHGFFWPEENVVLNYFPTQDGGWVLVCPWILIRHRQSWMILWQMLSQYLLKCSYCLGRCYCQDYYGRSYCHDYGQMLMPIFVKCSYCLGRCYCQDYCGRSYCHDYRQMLMPLCVWDGNTTLLFVIVCVAKQGGRCYCHCFLLKMVKPHD